jgi:hypothetical protein
LGQVVRDGDGVRRMLLYRYAVEETLTPALSLEGRGGRTLTPDDSLEGRGKNTFDLDGSLGGGKEEVEVMAVVEGYVMDVLCSICGSVRTWVPGDEAVKRLMRQKRLTKSE